MYLKRTEYFDKEGKLQGNKYKLQFIYLIGGGFLTRGKQQNALNIYNLLLPRVKNPPPN